MIATEPETTNALMASWFMVSERVIRKDKEWIRARKASFLKDEMSKDLSLVIADIAMDFEKQVRDIEKSKGKCKLGMKAYVDHCNSIFDMRLKMVKAFQDIGFLPKNLGNMTVDKFEYKAIVLKDGSTVTRESNMVFADANADESKTPDADFTDVDKKPAQLAAAPVDIVHADTCLTMRRHKGAACTCGAMEATAAARVNLDLES